MHKLAIIALAAAMGLAWSTIPAVAADPNDKTIKDKAVDTKDTVKEKTSEAWDKTKEKTSEAWDKTKEKTTEAKDKVKDKARDTKDKLAAKTERSADIRQAQMALKDMGHDPGPIDGIHGPRTSAALRSYQKAENIKVTGRLDSETKSHLIPGQASAAPSTATPAASPSTINQPVPPPASTGSPSAPPLPAEKTQTK